MPGIDQQIEQRKMQFGNNPQALQQRYGQSKQLLDLLALQQIAQEQQQKAQAMQMQMQQNPATIAQQVEQEVIQGKKAEMAQNISGLQSMRAPKRSQSETARGVAGALAQKQREQQSRMQNIAKQGVASQPARNMERMYDGGIVGYAGGDFVVGDITQDELDYYMSQNPEMSRDQAIQRLKKRGKGLRMAETFLGKRREASAAARRERLAQDEAALRERRAQDEAVQEERKQALSQQRAREEGYDVEGLDLTGITLPRQGVPDLTQRAVEEEAVSLEPAEERLMAPQAAPTPTAQSIFDSVKGMVGTEPQAPAAVAAQPEPPTEAQLPQSTPAAAPAAKPSMQEQLLQRLMESSQKEQEDITSAREALEAQYSGRSKGRKFLDLFKRAAQAQAQGPLRTTNRAALAGLLGGMATAEGEEKETYKKGLESIAERQRALTQGQLGVATGLAGIKRGEEMTELERRRVAEQEAAGAAGRKLSVDQLAENRRQFDVGLAADIKRAEQTLAMQASQLAATVGAGAESRRIQEEFNKASNKIAQAELKLKQKGDPNDYINAMQAYESSIKKYIGDLISASYGDEERIAALQRMGDQLIEQRYEMIRTMARTEDVVIPEMATSTGGALQQTADRIVGG
jgi:hypothetical protein